MKNPKFTGLLVGILAAITGFIIWFRARDRAHQLEIEAPFKNSSEAVAAPTPVAPIGAPSGIQGNPVKEMLKTPLHFYGLVLDLNGIPVSGAQVNARVMNNLNEGTIVATTSDEMGKFAIESNGISLHIEVSKSGYYKVLRGGKLNSSSQSFDFGLDVGNGIYHPNPASPTVFQLRKFGNPVPLERIAVNSHIPRDGSLIAVHLSHANKGTMQIRCFFSREHPEIPTAAYDWRCEISVEGGAIQDVVDFDNFTAPETGYHPTAVIEMPKSLGAKKWSSRAIKGYWLRFPDNTFAKVELQLITGENSYADIEGVWNRSPNSRNLEPTIRE